MPLIAFLPPPSPSPEKCYIKYLSDEKLILPACLSAFRSAPLEEAQMCRDAVAAPRCRLLFGSAERPLGFPPWVSPGLCSSRSPSPGCSVPGMPRWDVRAPWKSLLVLREGEEVFFLSGVGASVVSVMDSHCDRL